MIRSVHKSPAVAALLLVLALLTGCAQSLYRQGVAASGEGDYDTALDLLYEAARQDPGDHRAWMEIGKAWYGQGALDKAEEAFASSNRIRPTAQANLYLGLIFEKTGEMEKAIRVYSAASRLQGTGKTKEMIEERLAVLIDRQLVEEARLAVAGEDELDTGSLPENSIAVINFDGSNLPADLEPMAVGLAEFIAMDLAKVEELKVLERLKINVILDELQLSQSSYADAGSAPRMGKLLGSSKIVLGTVTSTGEDGFRVDGRLVNTGDGTASGTQTGEGELESFFEVEKQFVFGLLDTLGVSLSKEERDAIAEVPTESFLAFMAYSEGLFYERRGMYDDAARAFGSARDHDPGFGQAAVMSGKMDMASSFDREAKGEPPGPGGGFESKVTSGIRSGEAGDGLDGIQAANLLNSNFILSDQLYWDFGSLPYAPPGGGAVWRGHGIIIIRGNFDAE